MTGIVPPGRAELLAAGLFDTAMFSGWGIRTLAADQPRFDPIAYHNGSIWPHDNALIDWGLARCGYTERAESC
jgi:glycogen debranching enzyme